MESLSKYRPRYRETEERQRKYRRAAETGGQRRGKMYRQEETHRYRGGWKRRRM
jgi:hypothetical protein